MARLSRVLLLVSCVFLRGDSLLAVTGGACAASVPSGITKCFYADYANGSDANAGTSETAPLQHFPGMAGCAKNCSSITPAAGEGFVLRGGITWPAAALPWYWTWAGTGTASTPGCTGAGCIYIGVDPDWYTGASWSRPVLNAGGSSLGPINTLFGMGGPVNYLILDNLEFTGLFWSGSPTYGNGANLTLQGGSPGEGVGLQLEHLYIHGWSHGSASSGTVENPCGIVGDTGAPNNNAGSILEYSVISGADTTQDSCSEVFGSPPYIEYNVFEYGSSAMVIDSPITVHDNIIQHVVSSFDTSAHENALEENFSGNTTVYNNVFRHIGSGSLTIWLAPDSGYTAYFFNNVVYDTDVNNVIDLAASLKGETGTDILWNNTIECGQDSNPNAVCVANIASAVSAVTLQNNHFITNAGSYWSTNGPKPTLTTNTLQTRSQANGQGYNSSEAYAFAPTAPYPTDATPGQGTSAGSLCSAAGVSSTVCSNDTTYSVVYNTTNHTVTSPGRTTVLWKSPPDVGAYSYGTAPGAPTNLTGSVVPQ
jgi:hypothetical protein